MIFYFCPDIQVRSAGIRILYRHVELLAQHGIPAAILHRSTAFRMEDVPHVPVLYLDSNPVKAGDYVVLPEAFSELWKTFEGLDLHRFMIALNWDYIFKNPDRDADWRGLGVQHVLTHSPYIADVISWCMRLPVTVFPWAINSSLYFPQYQKTSEIVFIGRKQHRIDALLKILALRDPRFVTQFQWTLVDNHSELEYAALVRRAMLFVNLSPAEGLPCSLLEAMRCHTIVAGYNSVGGQLELIGDGPKQNMILAETQDYPTLAKRIEPLLNSALTGDLASYAPIIKAAAITSLKYNEQNETNSVVEMWRTFINQSAG